MKTFRQPAIRSARRGQDSKATSERSALVEALEARRLFTVPINRIAQLDGDQGSQPRSLLFATQSYVYGIAAPPGPAPAVIFRAATDGTDYFVGTIFPASYSSTFAQPLPTD